MCQKMKDSVFWKFGSILSPSTTTTTVRRCDKSEITWPLPITPRDRIPREEPPHLDFSNIPKHIKNTFPKNVQNIFPWTQDTWISHLDHLFSTVSNLLTQFFNFFGWKFWPKTGENNRPTNIEQIYKY